MSERHKDVTAVVLAHAGLVVVADGEAVPDGLHLGAADSRENDFVARMIDAHLFRRFVAFGGLAIVANGIANDATLNEVNGTRWSGRCWLHRSRFLHRQLQSVGQRRHVVQFAWPRSSRIE